MTPSLKEMEIEMYGTAATDLLLTLGRAQENGDSRTGSNGVNNFATDMHECELRPGKTTYRKTFPLIDQGVSCTPFLIISLL